MKRMLEDGSTADSSLFEDINVDPVVRGFIRDWDAMEDLLHYVLYTGLDWEEGNEGQVLFTDPLCTPKVLQWFSPFFIFAILENMMRTHLLLFLLLFLKGK